MPVLSNFFQRNILRLMEKHMDFNFTATEQVDRLRAIETEVIHILFALIVLTTMILNSFPSFHS
jgi:hypothetical protein